MAGITLAQAQERLDAWLAADAAVAKGQSYQVQGRTVTRTDADTIRQNIDYWDSKVREIEAAGNSVRGRRVRFGTLIP